MIRHFVAFAFKKEVTEELVSEADRRFKELPELIDYISSFESGVNISPEKLNKGFSHAYFVTFSNEKLRDDYLVDPNHKRFTDYIGELIDDVFVMDYEVSERG